MRAATGGAGGRAPVAAAPAAATGADAPFGAAGPPSREQEAASSARIRAAMAPPSDWIAILLLVVFTTHLPFFWWRYVRTREIRYAATSLTFALLVLAWGLRVFAPAASVGGVALHRIARVPALASALLSVGLLLRHHARRLRRAAAGPTRSRGPKPR
jgi:hypothetical protein